MNPTRMMSPFYATISLFGLWLILLSACQTGTTDAQSVQNHKHHQKQAAQIPGDSPAYPMSRYTRMTATYTPPEVTLVDMMGAKVSLDSVLDYEGPVLMQFIFTTCPTICPVMSATFSAAQDKFGADLDKIRMVSISIDPEHDTPERLRKYAEQFKAKPQWHFLTGSLADIVTIQKAFNAYRGNKMRHEPFTYLRPSPEAPWIRFDGLMGADALVAEIGIDSMSNQR
jgi:protein SCO1